MIRINLLRPETKDLREAAPSAAPEAKPKIKPALGNLIVLLLIAALAVTYYLQNRALRKEQDLLAQANEEKSKLQYVLTKLDELNAQKTKLQRKVNLITQLKSQQDIVVRIMDELSRNLPDWVWLNEVTFDNLKLQIRGNALSNNLVADYIYSLENSPYISDVELLDSSQRAVGSDQFLDFSLSARVLPIPIDQPPSPGQPEAQKRGKP